MEGNTWCHFIQRTPFVKRPKAQEKRTQGFLSSKYSYVVIEKHASNREETTPYTTNDRSSWSRLVRYVIRIQNSFDNIHDVTV